MLLALSRSLALLIKGFPEPLSQRSRWELARDLWRDVRFDGIALEAFFGTDWEWTGAYPTMCAEYEALDRLFPGAIVPEADDVLVDVGCGPGRVFNHWLTQGYRQRMIGVEIDRQLAARTDRRLKKYSNVEIRAASVLAAFPREGTLFYLFNPFSREMTEAFEHLVRVRPNRPERVRIVYYNALHAGAFHTEHWNRRVVDNMRWPTLILERR